MSNFKIQGVLGPSLLPLSDVHDYHLYRNRWNFFSRLCKFLSLLLRENVLASLNIGCHHGQPTNRDMCKFESSQKDESRWQSTDSSKAYRNTSAFKYQYRLSSISDTYSVCRRQFYISNFAIKYTATGLSIHEICLSLADPVGYGVQEREARLKRHEIETCMRCQPRPVVPNRGAAAPWGAIYSAQG